jgi:SAM-dependent methyltransferase
MDKEYMLMTGNDLGRQQVHCLEAILDPYTTDCLSDVGVKAGQRCLDVGAGGGSITRWLAGRVGPGGTVVSIDQEAKWAIDQSGVDWRQHDINAGVPEGQYDLIHVRLVLMHLARREELLQNLAAALKPGGWLVVGEFAGPPLDVVSAPSPEDEELFHRVQSVTTGTIGSRGGINYQWAAQVDKNMVAAGLANVETSRFSSVDAGGSPGCLLHRNYNLQVQSLLLQEGFTDVELKRYQEMMLDPQFRVWMYTFYLSRGQKPLA